MQTISAQAVPNQQLQVQVGGQGATLNIYQTNFGLFMDVLIGSTAIVSGVICENLNRIIRDAYLGFIGDFIWVDLQDTTDPIYTGIGSRYLLIYLSLADLTGVGQSG